MDTPIIHSMQGTYAVAIFLAEKQLKEATSKLHNLEYDEGSSKNSEAVQGQRQVVGDLQSNLLDMKGSYFTLFGALPPLP